MYSSVGIDCDDTPKPHLQVKLANPKIDLYYPYVEPTTINHIVDFNRSVIVPKSRATSGISKNQMQLFGIHMLAVAQTLNVNIQIKFIQQAACFPWNITLSIHKRLNLKRNI